MADERGGDRELGERTGAWAEHPGRFALIATIGVAIPVVVYFSLGDRAPAMLQCLQAWMAQNNAVIMSVLILVIGVKVLGDGLGKL